MNKHQQPPSTSQTSSSADHTFDPERKTKLSKFMSKVLRHSPEQIGITLDAQGWVPVEELLSAANRAGKRLSREWLLHIVATCDKQRFALSPDGLRIRASQGHSITVDLGYTPVEPPEILYHGTVPKFLDAIREGGLLKMNRHHVHLSQDLETATRVGDRRGKAVILKVRAKEMHRAGFRYFQSQNGVWLTDHVPPRYIDFP